MIPLLDWPRTGVRTRRREIASEAFLRNGHAGKATLTCSAAPPEPKWPECPLDIDPRLEAERNRQGDKAVRRGSTQYRSELPRRHETWPGRNRPCRCTGEFPEAWRCRIPGLPE